jgi:protein-S-isoprenylcysteine O-methyltransferase Ste14
LPDNHVFPEQTHRHSPLVALLSWNECFMMAVLPTESVMKTLIFKKLELLIPPPIIALLLALLMWAVAPFVPRPQQLPLYHLVICSAAFAGGVLSAILGVYSFWRHHTTINPHAPQKTSFLVTTGIYRITRNPMYVGIMLVLASWALYLTHILPLILLPLFIVYINRFQIGPEERMLEQRFGTEFTSYRDSVRRWL